MTEDFDHTPSKAEQVVDEIIEQVGLLDGAAERMFDLRPVLTLLRKVQEAYKSLRLVEDEIHARASKLLGKDKMREVEGLGFVERNVSARTTWDDEAVRRRIIKRAENINKDTGEITIDWRKVVDDVVAASSTAYWRVQELEKRGVPVDDEIRTRTWGSPRIRFRGEG